MMNTNIEINKTELTINSREVARMVEKEHKNLLADIRVYIDNMEIDGKLKIQPSDFFRESTYLSKQNKKLICYEITKKGCEFIANKLTGQKGTLFTATYINRFHEMEDIIKNRSRQLDKDKSLEIKDRNSRVRAANVLYKLAKVNTLSEGYQNILVAKAAEVLVGTDVIPLPKSKQKTYTATEIGKMFGVTANKIGCIANKNNLKTKEYGAYYRDISRTSNKEIDTFRYYDTVIPKFKEILGIK